MGRGARRSEEIADLGPLRHLVRADHLRPVHDFLLVKADQGPEDRMVGNGVDRSQARDGLARDLTQVLPGHEDVGAFAVSNRVGQADHQALGQDEVEAAVRSLGDLRERLSHPNHVQRRDPQDPAQGPGLHRGGVVGDRLQRKMGRYEVEALTGHEVAGDRTPHGPSGPRRSEEHTSELQSQSNLVCRLLLEKKKKKTKKLSYARTIKTNTTVAYIN